MSGLTDQQQEAVRQFLVWAIPEKWKTQSDAGKALGSSQEYVSQLRNGVKPIGPSAALKIAIAARVSFEDLISGRALQRESEKTAHPAEHTRRKRSITPTPTPAPTSEVRSERDSFPMPAMPANRRRAIELLVARGHDHDAVDESFALIAFDAELSPFEDRPVSWWIDCYRARSQSAR